MLVWLQRLCVGWLEELKIMLTQFNCNCNCLLELSSAIQTYLIAPDIDRETEKTIFIPFYDLLTLTCCF